MTVRTMPSSGIDLVHGTEVTTVRLWGEIDASLRNPAGAALAGALESDLPVVVDSAEVTFLDSAGAAFLVQLCTLGRHEGVSVCLCDPPPAVAHVLRLAGYEDAICDARSAAAAGSVPAARNTSAARSTSAA